MTSKEEFFTHVDSVERQVAALQRRNRDLQKTILDMDAEFTITLQKLSKLVRMCNTYEETAVRPLLKRIEELEQENQKLRDQLQKDVIEDSQKEIFYQKDYRDFYRNQSYTIAVFDTLLKFVRTCDPSGSSADVELASKAILYPSIYERVMSGDDPDYFFTEFPEKMEITQVAVKDLIQQIRAETKDPITDPTLWEYFSEKISKFWLEIGLTLLYDRFDETIQDVKPFTLDQMNKWDRNPADRLLVFPSINEAINAMGNYWTKYNDCDKLTKFLTSINLYGS